MKKDKKAIIGEDAVRDMFTTQRSQQIVGKPHRPNVADVVGKPPAKPKKPKKS